MATLESFEVKGFWGDRNFSIDFFPDVNFVIGPNGTGKTTLINLVAAILNMDLLNLYRIPFASASIRLRSTDSRRKPSVSVTKVFDDRKRTVDFHYSIKPSSNATPIDFVLEAFDEDVVRRRPRWMSSTLKNQKPSDFMEMLSSLAPNTWLSIHRSPDRVGPSEQSYDSSIDRKLAEITVALIRYFGTLKTKASEEINRFQAIIFRSLLHVEDKNHLFGRFDQIDVEADLTTLQSIYKDFKIPEMNYRYDLLEHRQHYRDFNRPGVEIEHTYLRNIQMVLNFHRIHKIVQDWKKVTDKQNDIYRPRDDFIAVLNNLLQMKSVAVNPDNDISFTTQSGKVLLASELSSGEKQLLILLSGALLQEQQSHIYIADEPELSLHVLWQNALVPSIKRINPKAQLLFATHSPDVVGQFSNNIIEMEKYVR